MMRFLKSLFGKIKIEQNPSTGLWLYSDNYADTPVPPSDYPECNCFDTSWPLQNRFGGTKSAEEGSSLESLPLGYPEPVLHVDPLSQSQRAWDIACEVIHTTAKKGLKELNLGKEMDRSDFMALNTLPESIGGLKDLERLVLYASNLSSLPRELSRCGRLKWFEPYKSYRLHWLPYEMKHCSRLSDSCISTRALYGNYRMRSPFPDLNKCKWEWPIGRSYCSVCGLEVACLEQYWTSQVVATDVVPLLVSVCSKSCFERIEDGPEDYIQKPHKGGVLLQQPRIEWMKYLD